MLEILVMTNALMGLPHTHVDENESGMYVSR